MIFITLGTQKFQFNRLLEYIDNEIKKNNITEKVFAQIGNSTYVPRNYEYKKFLDKEEFEDILCSADIVITHAGVGTILSSVRHEKKTVVVPRLKKYGEHVDNHQLQIAETFSEKNFVITNGEDIHNLLENVEKARNKSFDKYYSSNQKIQNIIETFVMNNL